MTTTTLNNTIATVKFHKGNNKSGFGFFIVEGFADVHVYSTQLPDWGFSLEDMRPGLTASLDLELDDKGQLTLIRINKIGDKLASAPAPIKQPKPAASTNSGPASDIEFDGQETPLVRETHFGRKIGDIVVCRLRAGFDEDKPRHGFFAPNDGGRDIFVYINNVATKLQQTIGDTDVEYDVIVSGFNSRGIVGKVQHRHVDVTKTPMRPELHAVAEKLAADEEEQRKRKLAEKQARQDALLRRKPIRVASVFSSNLTGIPVTKDEWASLPGDKFGVMFDSYDPKTGPVGEPIEHFQVKKTGGKTERVNVKSGIWLQEETPAQVTTTTPTNVAAKIVSKGIAIFKTADGDTATAPIYEPRSKAEFEQVKRMVAKNSIRIALKQGAEHRLGQFVNGKLVMIQANLETVLNRPQAA